MSTSIKVDHVTKDFKLRYHRTFKQVTVAKLRGQKISDTFLAVNDVSFSVEQGEAIGLMGLNGSGKSTLLRMIAGIMKPNAGTIQTRGRIAGLIATGAGFHPQLTGRENIYLNGAALGLSAKEIENSFDDIVEFSELGKFIDVQVGTYSSGMTARLGFAVAIHVDCDIFLADEALAVGDKPFKIKCMDKIEEIRRSGRTIIYVSHAAASVAKICERVIVLEQGKLGFDGPALDGIRYLHYDSDEDEEYGEFEFGDEELGADI